MPLEDKHKIVPISQITLRLYAYIQHRMQKFLKVYLISDSKFLLS